MKHECHSVNYRVADRDLKYYIFDWDDNILHMPTRIHLERQLPDGRWIPHQVSTAVFSVIRHDTAQYRPPDGNWAAAFREFQDLPDQGESAFLRDTRAAIHRALCEPDNRAPSFQTFHRTLVEGRLFAIVTARGHDAATLRKGVETFIAEVLSPSEQNTMLSNLRGYMACFDGETEPVRDDQAVLQYYLDLNRYHAVTSPLFQSRFPQRDDGVETPETRKQFAVRDFVEHVVSIVSRTGIKRPVSVGFSDDDPSNVAAVHAFIQRELTRCFPGIKFVVYDTSDPELDNGRKIIVSGQLDLGLCK